MNVKAGEIHQGVVGIRRVTVKKGGPMSTFQITLTLFLTFSRPELPKVSLRYGYPLQVMADLFVPNRLDPATAVFWVQQLSLATQVTRGCKVGPKCVQCERQKHDGECDGPKMWVRTLLLPKFAQSGKRKRRLIQRVRVEKRIPFWGKARN